ncbi:MAG: Spo0J and IME4 domain-containing protein [bacterium]
MAGIEWVPIEKIKPHPKNPRLIVREDVVQGIMAGIVNEFHEANALQVWPENDYYIILSGHHRFEAAKRVEFTKIPCWIRNDLDEDQAYMLLATDNNQGELSPLEIGMHALNYVPKAAGGRGQKGGLSEYAGKLGKAKGAITEYKNAAEVLSNCSLERTVYDLLDKAKHLSAIHSLPESCWQEAVDFMLKKGWSAKDTQKQIKAAKEGTTNKQIINIFTGKTTIRELNRIKELKDKISESLQYDDTKEQWIAWFEENDPIDIKEVQNKRNDLENIEAQRKEYEEEQQKQEYPSLVLADPPWRYDFAESDSRQVENRYPSLTVDEIISHKPETEPNCVLFLWATAPKLKEAFEVMDAWGFEYKTHGIWDKEKVGMGYWFRNQHELLLVGTKGQISPPDSKNRISSILKEYRKSHSEKPLCVYEWIENAFPQLKKLEMFCREQRQGWEAHGNEVK